MNFERRCFPYSSNVVPVIGLVPLILTMTIFLSACSQEATPTPRTTPSLPPNTPTPYHAATTTLTEIAPTSAAPSLPDNAVLVVPYGWAEIAGRALDLVQQNLPAVNWELRELERLDGLFEPGSTEIALVPGGEGIRVGEMPVVFTVPFSSSWEGITLAEAEAILAQRHPVISVEHWIGLTPSHRALPIDGIPPTDPNYPMLTQWSLNFDPGFGTLSAILAPFLRSALEDTPWVSLAAVGDIMLDRGLGEAIRDGDPTFPFYEIGSLLSSADITIGNLESALGEGGTRQQKRYTFRAPTESVQTLSEAGFDLLALANNHAMDYGSEALLVGIQTLLESGILTVGAGIDMRAAHTPTIIQSNGLRLAFLAYVNVPVEASGFDTRSWAATETQPGVAWGDPNDISADVAAARSEADLVIVILHSGFESWEQTNTVQEICARAAVDAGASLVIGHHAHALQGIAFYKHGVIAYGLGNFAFQMNADPRSMILVARFDRDGVRQLEIVPIMLDNLGRPRPASGDEASEIRRHVYQLSALLDHEGED